MNLMILVTKVQLIDSISAFKIIMLYEFATLIDDSLNNSGRFIMLASFGSAKDR